jgi:hypothetical protein
LRWRDRLAWAWVTIPALTLSFAGLAYWFGFSLRGGDIIVNQVTIKEMDSAGRTTRSQTYVGLFSPRRQSYNIEVATDALLRPLGQGGYDPWSGIPGPSGSVRIVQGQPARIQGLTVDQWSMQSFAAETIPNDSPGLVAHLTAGRDSVHGQVINQSSDTWQDVVVVFYTRFQKLGDLAPGQAAEISFNFEDSGSVVNFNSYMLYQDDFNQANGPSREINFKQAVLDYTIFNSNRPELSDSPILIAWQKGGNPLEIGLEGYRIDTRQTTLLFGPLGLTFEGTQVTVPPGFSHLEVVSTTGNASTCSYGGGTVGAYVYQGTLETKLSLPKNVRQVQPDHLDLHIRTDGSWQELPNIELYDQTNGAWVFLEGAVQGPNPIPDTARFYNRDDASMQVRISNSDIAGGCLFLELALEGERL